MGAGEGVRGEGLPRERDRVTSWRRIGRSAVSGAELGPWVDTWGVGFLTQERPLPEGSAGSLQPGIEEAGRAGPQCPWAPAQWQTLQFPRKEVPGGQLRGL